MNASGGSPLKLNWPEPCESSAYVPMLRLTTLSPDIKSFVWSDLKTYNPKKATELKILAGDEVVKGLIAEFGASLMLSKEDLSSGAYKRLKRFFE